MENRKITGVVFDIDHFAVHDGQGIRSCIYLKGCPLKCLWCHSPESQEIKPELLYASGRCINCGACVMECPYGAHRLEEGRHRFDWNQCCRCGACTGICSQNALIMSGKVMEASQAAEQVLADKIFYKNSGGGVTLSGGEVLMQAPFAREILRILKLEDIHTIVETSGYGRGEDLLSLAEYTDLFYYDFKLGNSEAFKKYTGGDLKVVLDNLKKLSNVTRNIVLRVPVIPGITDTEENIRTMYKTAQELKISQVHLLPYNTSAGAKYEWCHRTYLLGKLDGDRKKLEYFKNMAPKGIEAEIN